MLTTSDAHGLYTRFGFEPKDAMIAPGAGAPPVPKPEKKS